MVRSGRLSHDLELADLPGIRVKDDSRATREAINIIHKADIAALVVRATHVSVELPLLLNNVNLNHNNTVLILTFADKVKTSLSDIVCHYRDWLGVPVHAVDARNLHAAESMELIRDVSHSKSSPLKARSFKAPNFPVVRPQITWFEHPYWGRPLALIAAFLIFALPVFLAYLLSNWLQPIADQLIIDPVRAWADALPLPIQSMIAGDYGLVTLGWYSFLWAFPVVLLLGMSIAITEETGLKDRITDSLDGWLRNIGLSGRDLIPVLSGFGCNVVAVYQSRACNACTRKSCVSLVAFGSACSYQIGASLSIFGSAGHPWMFLPYLLVLGFVGAVHTRIWNRKRGFDGEVVYQGQTFLQAPRMRALLWRVRTVVKQFLLQAMPIFITICFAATLLQLSGLMAKLAKTAEPLMNLLHLPAEAASGIVFSILRKDGLLILNQGDGTFLQTLHTGQIFVLVYLASTLTACLVTLWTVRKELGVRFASELAGKQMMTSLVSTGIIMLLVGR